MCREVRQTPSLSSLDFPTLSALKCVSFNFYYMYIFKAKFLLLPTWCCQLCVTFLLPRSWLSLCSLFPHLDSDWCYSAIPRITFLSFINCFQPLSLDPFSKHILTLVLYSFPLSYLSFCVILMRETFKSRKEDLDTATIHAFQKSPNLLLQLHRLLSLLSLISDPFLPLFILFCLPNLSHSYASRSLQCREVSRTCKVCGDPKRSSFCQPALPNFRRKWDFTSKHATFSV